MFFFSVVFISQLKFSFVSNFSLTLSTHFQVLPILIYVVLSCILPFSQCLCLFGNRHRSFDLLLIVFLVFSIISLGGVLLLILIFP